MSLCLYKDIEKRIFPHSVIFSSFVSKIPKEKNRHKKNYEKTLNKLKSIIKVCFEIYKTN